jgi:hypothetical protein
MCKLAVSGPFESGGFFSFAGCFSSPLRSCPFLFSVKKKTLRSLHQLSCPFFRPTFNRPNPSGFTPALATEQPVGPSSQPKERVSGLGMAVRFVCVDRDNPLLMPPTYGCRWERR